MTNRRNQTLSSPHGGRTDHPHLGGLRLLLGGSLLGGFLLASLTTAPLLAETPQDEHGSHEHSSHEHSSHEHESHEHESHEHGSQGHDSHAMHDQHKNPDGLRHDFSDVERWSALFDDPERDTWQKPDHVVSLLGAAPGAVVADLGAGTGYFLGPLSRVVGADGRVLALEPEASLAAHMRERAAEAGWTQVEVRNIGYDDPGLEPASVDGILIVNTWHHIGERSRYAEALRRALRPGGRVLVVDYTLDSPQGPPRDHRLPPEQVITELNAGGLTAQQIDAGLPLQYVVLAARDADD